MGNKNTTVLREERELTRDYTIDPNQRQQQPNDHGAYFQGEIDNFFKTPLRNGFPTQNNSINNQNAAPTDTIGFIHHPSSPYPVANSSNNSNSNNTDPSKYVVNIPLGGNITPEDLKISLKKNVMTIAAKSKKANKNEYDSGSTTARVCQEFKKKFTLPSHVDPKQVKTTLTSDGNLRIEAPFSQNQNQKSSKSTTFSQTTPWPPTPVPVNTNTSQVYKRDMEVPVQYR